MKLTSTAFEDNHTLPDRYSYDYENISPPLQWIEVPEETRSFALIMDDPDAAAVIGKTFDHWVLYNVPNHLQEIQEALPRKSIIENVGTQGVTTRCELGYMGPRPPKGAGIHKYVFQLYALELEPTLPAGLTKDELYNKIAGHILSKATLLGLFSRQ